MNIEMMEMDDNARFTECGHTQWWREASTRIKRGEYPYSRSCVDFSTLLGFCSPGSSIVLLFADNPKCRRNLIDPLCRFMGNREGFSDSLKQTYAYEMDNPTIETITSALYAFVNEHPKGWLYVEYALATDTSLCLVLANSKRKISEVKKVDDLVLDLTRVWSPWLNPDDPKVSKWFSENMIDFVHLYGHRAGIEAFKSYSIDDGKHDITARLFDLSLTHYVKHISLPFADNHSVFMNLAPCSENGGQTNIDADFIEVVKRSMLEWKWH